MATASRRRLPALLGRRNGGRAGRADRRHRAARRAHQAPGQAPAARRRRRHRPRQHRPHRRRGADRSRRRARWSTPSPSSDGTLPERRAADAGPGRDPPGRRPGRRPLRAAQRRRPVTDRRRRGAGRRPARCCAAACSASPSWSASCDEQRERIDEALAEFAENTVAHVRQETDLLTGSIEFPPTRASFRDRHVLIVVRGDRHRRDLKALRAYIRDVRPLIVAVDGGADGVLEAGLKPDVILGDMDSATDAALRCGAELVVHAYPDGRAPGRERLLEARPRAHGRPRRRHQRGRGDADGLREGGDADRQRRRPLQPDRVPRPQARRHVLDLPHPAADRREAGRRQGGEPALQPELDPRRRWRSSSSPSWSC